MRVKINILCAECDAPDPNIIYIFTREHFCSAQCHSEGYLKLTRMILRANAEGLHNG